MLTDGHDSAIHLDELRRLETCICCARAELASDPHNLLLRDFIDLNEALARKQRSRLIAPDALV